MAKREMILGGALLALLAGCSAPVPDSLPEAQTRVGVVPGASPIVGGSSYVTTLPAADGATAAPPPAAGTTGFSTSVLGAAIDRAAGGGTAAAPAPVMAPAQPGAVIGAVAPPAADVGAPLSALNLPAAPAAPAAADPTVDSLDPLLHGQPAVLGSAPVVMAPAAPAPAAAPATPTSEPMDPMVAAAAPPPPPRIDPAALPAGDGTNIVRYALTTSHARGTQMHERPALQLSGGAGACKRYGSPDKAQEAFLAAGGPQKDSKGLDPDGDGFACDWDPAPFRAAMQ